ncbi:hypothetical protein FSARC_5484 [Fusarium sarcochroum]|uniref:FAD-binding PCMH-type domain-containing protein n=1 Tax=Fusarium sarcochroum TaxID=1208366 RepID=A0A8H4XAC4_9HYPO|nr:hypothetical protein FSARC_5484 [Fusarium sarcochroum]
MEFIAAGAAWALNRTSSPQKLLSRLGLASLVAQNTWPDLTAKLSPQASIVFPDDASFGGLVSRWREWHAPQAGAVVTAFTESDVQETIRYANEHGIPFLARSGGHGATEALNLAKDVIIVDLRGQDAIEIAEDGKSATIGGGARIKKVVNNLWAAGKETVTGICECVGISAPILGGGHGWLQGQYGLLSDQVISARVVLPSGEVVVASEESNPDLFWALRGAGHNFGIVTEWEYRIYDVKNPKWSYEIFIFLGDKLEEVLELTNKMMKTQPAELTTWMYIINIPEIDPNKPIIWYAVISDSPVQEARNYAKPLHDIGPINVNAGAVPMPDLAAITIMSDDSVACAKGATALRFPIGLKTYDAPALRKVYEEISEVSKRIPELAGSFFLLEGYSTHGVKAVDANNSAFPHRDDEILVTSAIIYKPNSTLNALAQEHGKNLRQYLLEASGDPEHLRAYVNYAHGDESLEEMYGHEPWRIEKLKELKKKWDPENPLVGNETQRRDLKQSDLNERVHHLEQLLGSIVSQLPPQKQQQAASAGSFSAKSPESSYPIHHGSIQSSHSEASEVKPGRMMANPNETIYVSSSHWSAICHEVEHIREHLDESNDSSDLGIVDQAQSQEPMLLGQGALTAGLEEILADVPPKTIADRLVARYFTSTEPSITPGKYTLEAVLFNIHGEFVRRRDAHLGVWILTGIAIRLAMRMGYHRDPDKYPRISPFEGEMRRRVWGVIQQLDILTSCQLGLPSLIQESQCDTRLPRNILDEDFGPESTQLPPPRPETQSTPVLYTIVKVKLMTVFRTIFNQVSLGKTENYEEIMALDKQLHQAHESMPSCFRIAKLEDCLMVPPYLLIRRYNLELLFQKARCTLHRHHMTKAYQDRQYNYSRTACVNSAMTVLGHQASILKEVQVGGLLYKDRWFLTSLERHDFSLASMVICLELSAPSHQQNWDLVGFTRQAMIEALQTSQTFWAALKEVSVEARQAYDMLSVMLNAVSASSSKDQQDSIPSLRSAEKAPALNDMRPDTNDTPVSAEFHGIEAMLNSSDGVDWDMWESLVHMPEDFQNYEMSEDP